MKPDPIWRLPAVGCTNLSNTGGKRETLYAVGYRRIDVLVAQGDVIHDANITELLSIGPKLKDDGWTICSWHSTTGVPTPETEAKTAVEAIELVQHLISGHNLNAEDWYEGAHAWKTKAYWDQFFKLADYPVAVWPMGSDAPEWPRLFDYQTCIDRGCMVYPQQYANLYPSYTIAAGDANLEKAGVPVENRGTSPGCYGASIPWDQYASDLATLKRPVLLYAADLGGFSTIEASKLVIPTKPEKRMIGEQDGITATFNRLRDLDPNGTLLRKIEDPKKPGSGKMIWEELSALDATPLTKWKAYDKAERALTILVEDHDASA